MVKEKEFKMAKIDVYPLAIRVITNPQWYPTPRRNIPIDVEGTVITITTTRKKSTNLLKKGDYIELILNDLYSSSCSIKVRWDNDTKAELRAGSVIIRSAKTSFCMTIWDSNLPSIDKRPYYELVPKYHKPHGFPCYATLKTAKLSTNDFLNTVSDKPYDTATSEHDQYIVVDNSPYKFTIPSAIKQSINAAYSTKYYVKLDQGAKPKHEVAQEDEQYEEYLNKVKQKEHLDSLWPKFAKLPPINEQEIEEIEEAEEDELDVQDPQNDTPEPMYPKFKKYIKLTDTLHNVLKYS